MKGYLQAVVFSSLFLLGYSLAPLPAGLPTTFSIGCQNLQNNDNISVPTGINYYYQYLAGDVLNNKTNWLSWQDPAKPPGQFVLEFINSATRIKALPAFSYYSIVTSAVMGNDDGADASIKKLGTPSFVNAYLANIALFMMKAGSNTSIPIIFHFEPDLMGYMERYSKDNISVVYVAMKNSGYAGMNAFTNDLPGLINGINYLRNLYAPNVLLAYHCSVWGTNVDIQKSKPSNSIVTSLSQQSASWLANLDPSNHFSLIFFETTDRDAAFYCAKDPQGAWCSASSSRNSTTSCCPLYWWNEDDWTRNILYIQGVLSIANKRGVFWQMPYGNSVMRTMDNTNHHFQDNKVQWVLGADDNKNMDRYNQIGVIAFLWGGGSDTTVTLLDTAKDGVYNPPAIDGNNRMSTSISDDGGYFATRSSAYLSRGFLSLPDYAQNSGNGTSGSNTSGSNTSGSNTSGGGSGNGGATGGSGRMNGVLSWVLKALY